MCGTLLILLFATLALFGVSNAIDVQGSIAWNVLCPGASGKLKRQNIKALDPQTKVVLDGGFYKASVRKDGGFTFFGVKPGAYLLEVLARDHVFDQLRVDVPQESSSLEKPHLSSHVSTTDGEALPAPAVAVPSVEVRPYLPGTSFSPFPPHPVLAYPILLTARQRKEYFAPAGSFDILPMLKNPMVMMMVFVCITLFLLPKAMQNMDPELMKEMSQRQDRIMNMQSNLQSGDFSGFASGVMENVNRTKGLAEEQSSSSSKRVASMPVASPSAGSNKRSAPKRKR